MHHPSFDYALSAIIDAAIRHAKNNGHQYWVPYHIEEWAGREKWSRLGEDELNMAKKQIKKASEEEKERVLLMYIGTTTDPGIKRPAT
ncbi:hypothetical protein COV19_04840 [Candidatus Woesearchaeota archaeon CG10_big_fil_rev_8_21_14_0_10_44_13]|nr:MAG: hypothetical protein COV19_04840 [Candidatus Woesearchaeota archaeon CG10_big_fil_rev_8_21_14_0_10_44_13]